MNQYRLDLAIVTEDRRIDVEVDGELYHKELDGSRARRDVERDIQLTALGWHVKRFWVYQVRDDLDACVRAVRGLLDESAPSDLDDSPGAAASPEPAVIEDVEGPDTPSDSRVRTMQIAPRRRAEVVWGGLLIDIEFVWSADTNALPTEVKEAAEKWALRNRPKQLLRGEMERSSFDAGSVRLSVRWRHKDLGGVRVHFQRNS